MSNNKLENPSANDEGNIDDAVEDEENVEGDIGDAVEDDEDKEEDDCKMGNMVDDEGR